MSENREEPQRDTPELPAAEELSEILHFFDDKEVMESKTVGDTHYTRGYIRDTEHEEVWAERGSGAIEPVTAGDSGISAKEFWRALTEDDAPTELGEQMQFEEELRKQIPEWADREVEVGRELWELADQAEDAREDFEQGDLTQEQYEERLREIGEVTQRLEDEQKTFAMEREEVEARQPVLEQYAQELAADGLTSDALAEHDWTRDANSSQHDLHSVLDSAQQLADLLNQHADQQSTEPADAATPSEDPPSPSIELGCDFDIDPPF
ncbi:hypothetical protein [Streptomyces nanshensis]|uniref:Uncharacterized protein n=1 Tax=Streptomyces nanshensis TaxID=518642 RepID=A0A1E7L9R8_9ACTN|nr:hypothetical protein [Streptomyces nanshensis]OEV12992.1 hypothetical protein AN218_05640 [Streptomyces nanshensis]